MTACTREERAGTAAAFKAAKPFPLWVLPREGGFGAMGSTHTLLTCQYLKAYRHRRLDALTEEFEQ